MNKIIAWLLVFSFVLGGMPKEVIKAASSGSIYYVPSGQQGRYTESLDEALQSCYVHGGTIVLERDVYYDFPDMIKYDLIRENTTLVVPDNIKLTIGKKGLQLNGTLQIRGGTVDLENSEGVLYGSGKVQILYGRFIKKSYLVNKNNNSACLETKNISYGQKLSEAVITEDRIHWSMPIPGTWKFVKDDLIPQAGVSSHDIVFEPENPLTYDSMYFEKSGKVMVNSVVPKRQDKKEIQISVGQNLKTIHPELTYISPITGEEVKGEFSFTEAAKEYDAGKHEIKGVFKPYDTNFDSVEEVVVVEILSVRPELIEPPVIRNQGTYGQCLNQIHYMGGKCRNPETGESLNGKWEWKDDSQTLKLGECEYTMVFIPDIKGYEIVEFPILVTTLPKVMGEFEWPSCSDLNYGENLSQSTLSFVKNSYGTFSWEDEKVCPCVKNKGVNVVFRPVDTERYDWSKVAGYDENTHTITCSIPIHVRPLKGKVPDVKAGEREEGMAVSGCALSIEPADAGTVMWQNPKEIVNQSGWYSVLFSPCDSDNYDWSSFEQDEEGRIYLKAHIKVTPKPTLVPTPTTMPAVTPTANPLSPDKNTSKENNKTNTQPKQMTTFMITQMVSKTSKIKALTVPQTTFLKCKRCNSKIRLVWKKKKGVSYQVQWSMNASFKKAHKKKVRKTAYTIRNVRKKKKYYIRIRCIQKKKGLVYYGKWSKVKKVSV